MTATIPPLRFGDQLNGLRSDLLAMGFETEEMLRDAVAALTESNSGGIVRRPIKEVAAAIVRRDNSVDRAETEIESACVQVLALQQTVQAADLHLILTVLKAAGSVERIGDHAVSIVKTVRRMERDGILYRPLIDIGQLGDMSRQMLHDALEAIVRHDTVLAQAVIDADDAVDRLYSQMRKDLQAAMERDPTVVRLASSLLFVIHYLERVSDRATSVAKQYLYLDSSNPPPTEQHSSES